MDHLAKLFQNGRSQAVRLPATYRFDDCEAVYIRRDPETGDVILSRKPSDWASFIEARDAALAAGEIPDDFLGPNERKQHLQSESRDPFRK